MKRTLSILLTVFLHCTLLGQQVEKIIQSGNGFYKKEQYPEAASRYSKAIETDSSNTIALFNLGNSLYKKNSRNEAIKVYTDLATKTNETGLRSDSYYNSGVVLGKQQKLEESIEAYKNALRQNPNNIEARENLQKALIELKKRTPPPKEPEKKKQNKQRDQQQSKMSPKEAQDRLKLMAQKEKEVQQRLQKEKSKSGGGQTKDW